MILSPQTLIERDSVDGYNHRNKLLNYKQISMIGTHNVRTLRKDTKRSELVENFNRCKLSVLGFVDHKISTYGRTDENTTSS